MIALGPTPAPRFTFKPREFVRDNPLPGGEPRDPQNDVLEVLRRVRECERPAGLDAVATPVHRRSRRHRDYWLFLIAGNLTLLALFCGWVMLGVAVHPWMSAMPDQFLPILERFFLHSPLLAMPSICMAFYSVALTWLMFGVMNDY